MSEPGLHNAPGEWRWEERESGWWRIHDELNIEDGPHTLGERYAERMFAEHTLTAEDEQKLAKLLSPHATYTECPQCGSALTPEHSHYRCTSCGWRDGCCD